MKKRVIVSALALALVSSPAFAKSHDHEKGHEKKESKHFDRDHGDRERHDRYDHDRNHRVSDHREHERHVSQESRRPPGWDKGKKTGWGDCDVPPGQAKKLGCHPDHGGRVARTHHERERHHHDRRPVEVAQNPRPRPYPRTTTTTTSTTTRTTTQNKGTHPFEPVLRQKQTAGGKDSKEIRQDVR